LYDESVWLNHLESSIVSLSKIVSLIVFTFSFWNMVISKTFDVIKTLTCTTFGQTLTTYNLIVIDNNLFYFQLYKNQDIIIDTSIITGELYRV